MFFHFNEDSWLVQCYSGLVLQVVIFVKSVQRCIALAQLLVEQNFPAIAIHRAMPQDFNVTVMIAGFF